MAAPNKNIASGWDEHMKNLGLPPSIYKSSTKSHIQLVDTKEISAMETENEMRITCVLLCKKQNVRDQILLKVNFWIDKRDINEDREIFNDEDTYSVGNDELKVVIEDVFIIGYFINETCGTKSSQDFYNFKNITGKDGMMNQGEMTKQLIDKRKARAA